MKMDGLTIREIAENLGIKPKAVMARILKHGIRPKAQAGRTNFYDYDVVDKIRDIGKAGRPKKGK
jgi:hypothetical protein